MLERGGGPIIKEGPTLYAFALKYVYGNPFQPQVYTPYLHGPVGRLVEASKAINNIPRITLRKQSYNISKSPVLLKWVPTAQFP